MSDEVALPALQTDDLADLPDDKLRERVRYGHRKVEEGMRATLIAAGETGAALREQRSRLEHGQWGEWLERHFPASKRTAQLYMQVADNWNEIQEEAKRVSGSLSYREAVRKIQRRETEERREKRREESIERARKKIESAEERGDITDEQANQARKHLSDDAERVSRGHLKPSTFNKRVRRLLRNQKRANQDASEMDPSAFSGIDVASLLANVEGLTSGLQVLLMQNRDGLPDGLASFRLAVALMELQGVINKVAGKVPRDLLEDARHDVEVEGPTVVEVDARDVEEDSDREDVA